VRSYRTAYCVSADNAICLHGVYYFKRSLHPHLSRTAGVNEVSICKIVAGPMRRERLCRSREPKLSRSEHPSFLPAQRRLGRR
jgi:hypothetical protein